MTSKVTIKEDCSVSVEKASISSVNALLYTLAKEKYVNVPLSEITYFNVNDTLSALHARLEVYRRQRVSA